MESGKGRASVSLAERDVGDPEPGGLRDAGTGIHEEDQDGVFGAAPWRFPVGGGKEGVRLRPGQPGDRLRRCPLHRDGADVAAPGDKGGVAAGHEAGEGTNGGQAPVPGFHGAATLRLDMVEEGAQPFGVEIVDDQPVDRFPGSCADEWQQEGERIPIALSGVLRQVPFTDDVLFEVAPEPRPHCPAITHLHLPSW